MGGTRCRGSTAKAVIVNVPVALRTTVNVMRYVVLIVYWHFLSRSAL